jgi:hypothetical protein
MPQMHLYVSREIAEEVRRRADRAGLTISQYLASVVRSAVADRWPDDYFSAVAGNWHGEPLERPEQPELENREPL